MQPVSDDKPALVIETRPLEDLSSATTISNLWHLRFLSQRCRESQMQNLVNQDFAQVVVQGDATFLCFCVCDGVGSSFRGDFAARYLSNNLVRWLQRLPGEEWSSPGITEQLHTQLAFWARQAHVELQQEVIDPETPVLVREVLDELRETYGSETVFLGGCLRILPWSDQTDSLPRTELFLCWMGNVLARLSLTSDRLITLGDEDDTIARWSTKNGPRGPLSIWQSTLPDFERLLVYTDGLASLSDTLALSDQEILQTSIKQLLQRPENDDMTFISIQRLYPEQRIRRVTQKKRGKEHTPEPTSLLMLFSFRAIALGRFAATLRLLRQPGLFQAAKTKEQKAVPRFQPFPGMLLQIGTGYFEFVADPFFPGEKDAVFALEGGEAFIYKLRDARGQNNPATWHALKVFKPSYRGDHIVRVSEYLESLDNLPGLRLGKRALITRASCPQLVKQFPDLEFAVLMPWINAPTWAGFLLDQNAGAHYTLDDARKLAIATASILWNIEERGLAHTDLAGCNIFLSPNDKEIQLLDLEGIYIPHMNAPEKVSYGSPGYQHRCLGPSGQWCPEGDRFAGAILLTEMLTWWNPRVRARVADFAETLFRPEELQVTGLPCWSAVRGALEALSGDLLRLFDQAWTSSTLAECPDFATWTLTLLSAFS